MANVNIVVGGSVIGNLKYLTGEDVELTEYTFEPLRETPKEFEYYMKRKDKIYLRNSLGRIIVSASNINTVMDGIKYGQKLICNYTLE